MNDLEIAKNRLHQRQLTLVIIKNGKVLFETQFHRISGFLTAIETLGNVLNDSSIADKVVGKAVALLCIYSNVKGVYAETLSIAGKTLLEKNRITCEWKDLVEIILDDRKKGECPFEKEAANLDNPKEAYEKFKTLQQKMRVC